MNKSQKRFMPKMGARGPALRPPPGRLSGLKSNYGPTPPQSQSRPNSEPNTNSQFNPADLVGVNPADLKLEHGKTQETMDNVVDPSSEANQANSQPLAQVDKNALTPQLSALNEFIKPSISFKESQSSEGLETNELPPVNRPEAPPGYEYVIPEDLPRLKALERKRKQEFERELIEEMRNVFHARERAHLMQQDQLNFDEADIRAQAKSEMMDFAQLKQAVGNEVKGFRERIEEEQSKQLIDVEQFTMGTLCKDIPVGDKNDSFDDYELARINRRRDTIRVFRAKMWSRRMYTPKEAEQQQLKEAYKKYRGERQSRSGKIKEEQILKMSELDSPEPEGSLPQASIEIQANGDISLVGTQFDRHKHNRAQENTQQERLEIDPTEQVINSHSFTTKERPDRWSSEETDKFYNALSAWGTDFNLISHLFPLRSRNQIKTKFKYEERKNPMRVQMHLVTRRKVNIDSYAKVSDVDIREIDSIESEIESVRKEHLDQMKLGEALKQQAKMEDDQRNFSQMK